MSTEELLAFSQPLKGIPACCFHRPHRLDQYSGTAALELTLDDLREIESAASKIRVQGARHLSAPNIWSE